MCSIHVELLCVELSSRYYHVFSYYSDVNFLFTFSWCKSGRGRATWDFN